MAVFPVKDTIPSVEFIAQADSANREAGRRKQVVSVVLLVITLFQLLQLPGAIIMHSALAIWSVILGLVLCGCAMFFNRLGRLTIVSILLIVIVDMGCGLMLLTTPMGLDVGDLPIFDVLIVSDLIAVSLLPAISIFPVAASNIIFIIADLIFQPRTPMLNMMLSSNMAYNSIIQPISLQVVVAAIAFIWVRSALRALARADRAEEIAELRRREIEQKQQLEHGVEHLSEVLVRASNGERSVRAQLSQDNMLWRISNSINLLLTRMGRIGLMEQENKLLRGEVSRLTEALHVAKALSYRKSETPAPKKATKQQP
ncbi:MAG: hypothetical protein JO011_12985 [Ktedonobacteraceae bacterium]|nr:hypothetical protein [Ktedonobacteraceae bacterium]